VFLALSWKIPSQIRCLEFASSGHPIPIIRNLERSGLGFWTNSRIFVLAEDSLHFRFGFERQPRPHWISSEEIGCLLLLLEFQQPARGPGWICDVPIEIFDVDHSREQNCEIKFSHFVPKYEISENRPGIDARYIENHSIAAQVSTQEVGCNIASQLLTMASGLAWY
jgi:hypothetical protein